MTSTLRVALAGAGAFGVKHLEAMQNIAGIEVVSIVGRELDKTREVAQRFRIGHVTTNLDETLARKDVDAVILATPTQLHAQQALACLRAGKHVQVEIPLCDRLADGEAVVELQRKAGLVAMCGTSASLSGSAINRSKK
ncbi:MAG TPA: Gfo/Idh/MocA family oxidoreductase, partial [Burkholderiaceae bacterium]|nr:Gfo/Idh/MocA family oxidoreductase [Burkholderiaceae bacterium]